MTRILLVPILLASLLLASCSTLHESPNTTLNESDPLIGKIISADQLTELTKANLLELISETDVTYLGETHNNIYQHNIQLQIITELVRRGYSPTIGFEFFSREQTAYLVSFVAAESAHGKTVSIEESARRLRSSLAWGANRDSDWDHLYPILKLAREAKLSVFGADLSSGLRGRMAKKGRAGLSAVEKLLVPASDLENESYRQLMYSIYTEAHCGWGNEQYMSKLYDTWLARNEAMSLAIVAAHSERPDQPLVMILGGGHILYNMGTVERVSHLNESLDQLSLRLLEVGREPLHAENHFTPPEGGLEAFGAPYEYIWFTARMPETPDPCSVFSKRKKRVN